MEKLLHQGGIEQTGRYSLEEPTTHPPPTEGSIRSAETVPDMPALDRSQPDGDGATREIAYSSGIVFRPLPEYEPPLLPYPPDELSVPSHTDYPSLPRIDAFQLALDLQWARDHRIEEQPILAVDLQATHRLLTAVLEVLDGRRQVAQLVDLVRPKVYAALETRARQLPMQQGSRLHRLHVCQPAKGILEASATVSRGEQLHALVARLERNRRGWCCSLLRLVDRATARS